jgi:hypothetical protein
MNWLEETVDVIMNWPVNSADVSSIESWWAIFKKLVRRMKRQTFQEQKSVLLSAWSLISQDTVDRLCKSFQTKLQLCLVNHG